MTDEQILNVVLQILGIQQNAASSAQLSALQTTVNQIRADTQATAVDVVALQNNQNTANEQIFIDLNALLARLTQLTNLIGQVQFAGQPVTLPPTPPRGYGGASSSDVATAVWEFPQPAAGDEHSGDLLAGAGLWGVNIGTAMGEFQLGLEPGWLVRGEWAAETSPPRDIPDVFDVTLILSSDTSVTQFLNRVYGTGYVADHFGRATLPDPDIATDWVYVSQWGQLEFDEWKLAAFGGAAVRVPPVWPGLANATLGTALALADGLTVPGPLDGVVISVTSVAPPTGFYPFGAIKSYVHLGGIVFVSDRGDAEASQGIGPQVQVITPMMIQHPDHAIIRLKSGTVGTVTPWVIV